MHSAQCSTYNNFGSNEPKIKPSLDPLTFGVLNGWDSGYPGKGEGPFTWFQGVCGFLLDIENIPQLRTLDNIGGMGDLALIKTWRGKFF